MVGDEGVLLLDQSAFFPYGCMYEDLLFLMILLTSTIFTIGREKDMLALYGDDGIVMDNTTATSSTSTSTSPSTEQQLSTTDGIRLSPSSRHGSPLASAYAIHGWNAVHRRLSNAGKLPPLDMHYILGRRSAFARAMYPLVRDAILHGLIMETESERVAK